MGELSEVGELNAIVSSGACPDENQLALLAEDAIAIEDRAALERHLDGCAACTRLVEELAQLAAPARSAPKRYRIIRQLGAGAMGVVWEAEDRQLARRVALKFVRPEGAGDRERRARLLREARALAQLRHPNVVAVHDVGTTDGGAGDEMFLALELVVGTNARGWRDAADRTDDEILGVWKQAATGLAAVHRAGIVHRDIKPDNVLVADDGRVLIGDFGLATGELGETSTSLTVSGAVVGTPLYMAPEQLHGDLATSKSDQFALCVCAWEALAGARPYAGGTIGALAVAMLQPPVVPARGDRRVFGVLARGLDPDPMERWPDVAALLDALERPRSRRRGWVFGIGAGVAAAAAAAIAMLASGGSAASPGPARTDPAPTPAVVAVTTPSRPGPMTGPGQVRATTPSSSKSPATTTPSSPRPATPAKPPSRAPTPASATQIASTTTPIPSLPRPVVSPPPRAGWHDTLERATDRLGFGDGKGCLQLLATIPPVPADQLEIAAGLRAACMMASGDCAGGRAALVGYGRTQGWTPEKIETAANGLDLAHCPLEAPPAKLQAQRALGRLTEAVGMNRSCKPVLDKMKQYGIKLADPRNTALLESACLVRDGDCTGALAKYTQMFVTPGGDPALNASMEASAKQAFPKLYPQCP